MAQRVWVVDDEHFIRTAMMAVLSEVGLEPRGFADAEELYTALVQEGTIPDLLVLDQRLPDEFGSTIAHSLRERPQYRDIPVLFVTAIDDEEAGRLSDLAKGVLAEAMARNLLLLSCGTYGQVVRIIPPLVTTEDEVEVALGVIGEALDAVDA